MSTIEERTLALAAVVQSCIQVQRLARTGSGDAQDFDTAVRSILTLDAVSSEAIFGGVDKLRTGLSSVADGLLVSPKMEHTEVLRYAMSLLHLQRELFSHPEAIRAFSQRVEALSSLTGDALSQECSSIYQEFVSVLKPQIIVNGEEAHLRQADVPIKIRTLLLAGIRAAVLWQQKGGGRFNLLWQRTRMQNAAKQYLRHSTH